VLGGFPVYLLFPGFDLSQQFRYFSWPELSSALSAGLQTARRRGKEDHTFQIGKQVSTCHTERRKTKREAKYTAITV
jgi:hypothetical protein